MESDLSIIQALLFLLFVGLSAFFSGAETAFMSLLQKGRETADRESEGQPRALSVFRHRSQELLISILIGNTLANISAATIAAMMAAALARRLDFNPDAAIAIEVLVVTVVLLVLSEITPKYIAVRHPAQFARAVARPMLFYFYLLLPVTLLLNALTDGAARLFGVRDRVYSFREDELRTLVEVSEEQGTIGEEEKQMIDSIFQFGKTQVREVMVPRIDMVCIEKNASFEELVELINQKGHSRIPLYEGSVDKILGIIHVKDLLPYLNRGERKIDLLSLAREALFVPEYKLIDELLSEFQREKIHMAIVVDEYGGTAGLVTLEDVLEEIVGEIQDEYDRETPLWRRIDENTFIVNAKIDLHDLNRELHMNLPTDEDYDSLGGFIFHKTGKVPEEKQVIRHDGFELQVEKVERNRILSVRIHRLPGAGEDRVIELENDQDDQE